MAEQPARSPDLRALDRIMDALQHAERKHPGWHTDPVRQAAIISEEAGEVIQATLNMVEEAERHESGMNRPDLEMKVIKEVAQTGAMALRYLINYERKLYADANPAGQASPDQAAR